MKMGFRWYGVGNDTVSLDDIRQIPGVETVVWSLHDKQAGEAWGEDEIAAEIATITRLTDEHRAVLDFEDQWFTEMTPKGAAVHELFGRPLVEHQRLVAWLIRQPEALEYAPTTVRRLQRLRDARLAARRSLREAS